MNTGTMAKRQRALPIAIMETISNGVINRNTKTQTATFIAAIIFEGAGAAGLQTQVIINSGSMGGLVIIPRTLERGRNGLTGKQI